MMMMKYIALSVTSIENWKTLKYHIFGIALPFLLFAMSVAVMTERRRINWDIKILSLINYVKE